MIVVWQAKKGMSASQRNVLSRKLHTHTLHARGTKYIRRGFLDSIPKLVLKAGVVVVQETDFDQLRCILRGKADMWCREVLLDDNDVASMFGDFVQTKDGSDDLTHCQKAR